MADKITKDSLEDFFNEPTKDKFKEFMSTHLGESNNLDFKRQWIDNEKLAKIILAIMNSGGGCIVIGVEETEEGLKATGLKQVTDMAQFSQKVLRFLPDRLHSMVSLKEFIYSDEVYGNLQGKKFQVIFIEVEEKYLPVLCNRDGDKIKKGDIFIRRGSATEVINYEELQELVSRRIDTQYSGTLEINLEQEIKQLKVLYDSVPLYVNTWGVSSILNSQLYAVMGKKENNHLPDESYEMFIKRMIDKKKTKIERMI